MNEPTAVFFDLETSDTLLLGQILNYSFIAVDAQFNPIADLSGEVALSRLQLPHCEAILANKINVDELTSQNPPNESQSMRAIRDFLLNQAANCSKKKPVLIGYNSKNFDLPFLRTSFLRNGIDPLLGNRYEHRDLLHLVRKLAITGGTFPVEQMVSPEDPSKKLCCRLENVTKALGLLVGEQTHESKDDVLLTISLAKALLTNYGIDIRHYHSYEAPNDLPLGAIVNSLEIDYEKECGNHIKTTPIMLFEQSKNYALWVDINRYQAGEGRTAIFWTSKSQSALFIEGAAAKDWAKHKEIRKQFPDLSIENFFQKSICDIEQDIYRLGFDSRDALCAAIHERDDTLLRSCADPDGDAGKLYDRYRITNYTWGNSRDSKVTQMIAKYAQERYSGGLIINKKISSHQQLVELLKTDQREKYLAPSAFTMMAQAQGALLDSDNVDSDNVKSKDKAKSKSVLESLIGYYHSCELTKIAPQIWDQTKNEF